MRKLNKKGKIAIVILLIFIISLIFGIIKLIHKKDETHILENNNNYNIKIDYPYIENKTVRKDVNKYIDTKLKEFKNIAKHKNYDLNILVNQSKFNNVTYVTIDNNTYTGGNHYETTKISYIYNKKNKLTINDFLNDDGLNRISKLTYYKIMQLNTDEMVYEDEWVKEGTSPKIENYQHFKFDDKGLELTFIPYQVNSSETKINLNYEEINKYLKEQYQIKNETIKVSLDVPKKRDLSKYKNKKLIAFTFDDGPSNKNTNYLLDNLDKYDAKVSFFVLGSRVKSNQEALKRAYLEGNTIGNHSYNHKNFNLLKDNEILDEIINTNKNIKEIIGYEPYLLRPPYGNLKQNDLTSMNIMLWDIDTLDWKYRDKYQIKERIMKNAHDGAIVLAHDIYKTSVDGVLLAMEELEKEGYAFVSLEEMFELKNINLELNKKYYNF